MKTKAQMHVYRLQDDEVAATIVDGEGALLDVIYLGKFTAKQYASLRKVIDRYEIKEKERRDRVGMPEVCEESIPDPHVCGDPD